MRLPDYLDKGASLGSNAPCLTMGDASLSYGAVQRLSYRVARALAGSGVAAGAHVAILAENDPVAFSCVFAIGRAGAIWCPINPRNEAAENAQVLDGFDCTALLFHSKFALLVEQLADQLPRLTLLVCIDADLSFAPSLDRWAGGDDRPFAVAPVGDVMMIPGTGGTTGVPKGVLLTDRNLETMTALTLIGYPFSGCPIYLAMAPLTHAAGVLALPILALGGEIVIMPKADIGEFLDLIERARITHTFLPPTLIYMLLDHPRLDATDRSSLQCFWYGAAPISAARLEEALTRIGPMAQLFGQTEAPMMISSLAPADHYLPDGSIAHTRLASAGKPGPLVTVATADPDGTILPRGETGEIVMRGALVMKGYYKNAAATAEATTPGGWHRTGDIGYLDADDYLFIVDRAKDMIITGGFNVYSAEVEKALQGHPAVQDCAVFGLPDVKWGERVAAVVQLRAGQIAEPDALIAYTKAAIGSVKAPKSIEIWPQLPRSKVGKVLKKEIRAGVLERSG